MIFAFTDGGCSNNGKKNAIASYSAVIIDGKSKKVISGRVSPNEYILNNNNTITTMGKAIAPSNNRGELLGIIHSLLYLVNEIDEKVDEKVDEKIDEKVDKKIKVEI